MARGETDDDEDERFGRTETLIEKSDRLAREYSREREIRQHTDRVRRIEGPKGTDGDGRAPRGRAPLDPSREEGTQLAPAPRAPPARASPPPANEPRKPRLRTAERAPAASPAQAPRERLKTAERAPAASAQAARERPKTLERPAVSSQLPKERAEPLPSAPPVAPRPAPPPARSALDDLAVELEELLRELRFGWRGLSGADRVTTGCSVSVIAGVLMPWVSDPAHSLRVGLLAGGVLHLAIALVALALVGRSSALRGLRMTRRDELAQHRRISLWLVLLGAASTIAGAYLLLLYGLSKTPDWPVQLHFGLYWTLVSGTGLSYGGFARFSDVRR